MRDVGDCRFVILVASALCSAVRCLSFLHPQGSPGIPGQPGRDGLSCRSELNYLTGSVLVRHSQSSSIPLCEEGEEQLWDGYSLLYIEGNERAHHQDLGIVSDIIHNF